MKKKLTSLQLNKKSISNLSVTTVTGKGPLTINHACNDISRDCVPTVLVTNNACGYTFDHVCVNFTRRNDCLDTRLRSVCYC